MNDLNTICKTNGTTQEEAREAAVPYYYRPKVKAAVEVQPPVDETHTSK